VAIRLKVFRFDPERDEKPYYKVYAVDAEPTDRLLDCLNHIGGSRTPPSPSACPAPRRLRLGRYADRRGMRPSLSKACRVTRPEVLIEPLPVFRLSRTWSLTWNPF